MYVWTLTNHNEKHLLTEKPTDEQVERILTLKYKEVDIASPLKKIRDRHWEVGLRTYGAVVSFDSWFVIKREVLAPDELIRRLGQ